MIRLLCVGLLGYMNRVMIFFWKYRLLAVELVQY
uniref:Uncharacterized protein n=1 Tax=Arundo donax TaxID=35708 RepID=A0A0A9DWK1_ARUDO